MNLKKRKKEKGNNLKMGFAINSTFEEYKWPPNLGLH